MVGEKIKRLWDDNRGPSFQVTWTVLHIYYKTF